MATTAKKKKPLRAARIRKFLAKSRGLKTFGEIRVGIKEPKETANRVASVLRRMSQSKEVTRRPRKDKGVTRLTYALNRKVAKTKSKA